MGYVSYFVLHITCIEFESRNRFSNSDLFSDVSGPNTLVFWREGLVLIFIEISIFILMYFIARGRIWILELSAYLSEAIIRRHPIYQRELRRVLPELDFNDTH